MSSCHDIISLDNDVSLNHDPSQYCIIFNFLNVIVIDGNRDIYIYKTRRRFSIEKRKGKFFYLYGVIRGNGS